MLWQQYRTFFLVAGMEVMKTCILYDMADTLAHDATTIRSDPLFVNPTVKVN